jgi:hypothetical protein
MPDESASKPGWRRGDPSRQPLRLGEEGLCVICRAPNDAEAPNSPYCTEHRVQARREARRRYREKVQQRRTAGARRIATSEGVLIPREEWTAIDRSLALLLAELARLQPGLPGRLPTQQWTRHAEAVREAAAEVQRLAGGKFPRVRGVDLMRGR